MKPGKVIIYSDEPVTGSGIAAMLTDLGYYYLSNVFTGLDVIHLIINEEPDLILLDIKPHSIKDWIGIYDKIREFTSIPVIFMVDPSDNELLHKVLTVHPWNVLLKPAGKKMLDTAIRSRLDSHATELRLNQRIKDLHHAMEGSRIGMWDWNIQTGVLIFNDCLADIFGYSRAESGSAPIRTWEELVHPEDLKGFEDKLLRHFTGELPFFAYEARMKHKNGSWISIHDRGKLTECDSEGKPVRMTGTIIDITDRNKTEEKIIRKERIFDTISYAATSMMSSLSEATITSYISRLGRVIGVSRAYIYTHENRPDGRSVISLKYEWVAERIQPKKDKEVLQNSEWEHTAYKHWVPVLRKGGVIYGNTKDFPDDEQFLLSKQQIRSIIVVPVYSRDIFFGFIGFEDNYSEHDWSPVELEALQTAAGLLAASFARQMAEEEVRNRENNFSTFFNTIEDFLFVLSTEGRIIKMNDTVIHRLGFTEDELVGEPLSIIYPENRRQEITEAFTGILSGIHQHYSIPLVSRDNGEIPVETRFISGVWNGLPALFSVSKDISAITLSEEKFSKAFHASGALMTISSLETDRFIEVNETFLNTLGYSRENVIGKRPSDLGLFEDPDIIVTVKEEMLKNGNSRNNKVMVKTRDNHSLTGILSADIITIQNREAILTVMNDITEITRLSDALLQANRKLHLLSSITRHDILNQIQTLFLAEGHLSRRIPGNSPAQEELEAISKSVDTIHRQILFTRDYQDLGVTAPVWEPVGKIFQNLQENSIFSDITLTIKTGNLEIFVDPMFPKVCFNLVENSLRHGKCVTTITLSFMEKTDTGILIFEDDGIGVTVQDKKRIFKKGFGKNTGLGLFLTVEILSITGIGIQETGMEGNGARFEITIPKGGWRFSDTDPED